MRRRFSIFAMLLAWLGNVQPSHSQGTIAYYQPATPILLWYETGNTITGYYPMDVDGDGNTDFTFAYSPVFLGVHSEGLNRILILMDPPPNIGGSIAPLPAGFLIGSGSSLDPLNWWAGFDGDVDPFDPLAIYLNGIASGPFAGQRAYMGVEFQSSGNTYYGWALLQISGDYAAIGQIESWAWETRSGVPIFAGAAPEPSTWALLGFGVVLLAWRRKIPG
jgi:PEP-CTERM motif